MSGAAAGAAAAAAAAQKAARSRQEEEDMTRYNREDLEGWEFKIVRANTRRFRNPDNIWQLCSQEAKAGWEMLEKFDDSRIRFKRRVDRRSRDQHVEIDPYRSEVGIGQGAIVAAVLGGLVITAGLIYALNAL